MTMKIVPRTGTFFLLSYEIGIKVLKLNVHFKKGSLFYSHLVIVALVMKP